MSQDEDLDGLAVPDKLFFRIGEVAELVGVEPHVLRYWESEFKLRPQRSDSGQRLYRRKDIARFLRIKRLLHDQGFTIAGARKSLADAAASPEEAPADPMDAGRAREAMSRLEEARLRIAELRERLQRPLGAPADSD